LKVPISTYKSDGKSRPSDNGRGGGGHPNPEIREGVVSKTFFSAL